MSAYRELASALLVAHQRRDAGSCLCGWSELGESWADHVAAVLDEAGALRDRPPTRWWHAFGAWTREIESVDPDTGETGPAWARMLVGPTKVPPETARHDDLDGTMTYLASWDHHPTDEEQDATDPPEVRDG